MGEDRSKVTLFRAPITTLKIFTIVSVRFAISLIQRCLAHKIAVLTFLFLLEHSVVLYYTPGIHQKHVKAIEEQALVGAYWLFLGVLSSIGLGTGLHTFVLYLGPFIAKVTLAAAECNSVDFLTYGEGSFVCPSSVIGEVSFWQILRKVQFEALLWGAGTALGELPPYFVARAARESGQTSEELEEFQKELEAKADTTFEKVAQGIKKGIFSALGKLGFFGIMLFASIPNPLFDLAGLLCGHLGVPFWTFFGATLVGKAFFKAHIQAMFVITMFSKKLLGYWIALIEQMLPFLKGSIDEFLEKERAKLHGGANVHIEKSMLSTLWDVVLILMVLYFVVSIINSSVQNYLAEREADQKKRDD